MPGYAQSSFVRDTFAELQYTHFDMESASDFMSWERMNVCSYIAKLVDPPTLPTLMFPKIVTFSFAKAQSATNA